MHINQLVLDKSSIKRKTCHTADFGQVWPEKYTHDWPSDKVVMQQTMAKCDKTMMPLVGGLCLIADFDQMWPEMCPSLEDFVMQRTLTKYGPKCAPRWRTCHAVDFDQMWPKMCPSSEDFVMQRTSTKCGQKCALHWRTLSCSGFQPNVAQNVPLVGGLCHTVDFNQMWPKMCPLLEDFVTQWTSTKCGPKCAPRWRTLSPSGL